MSCEAIFLSPHYDDAVFSCGGLIQRLTRRGRVLVVNVFSSESPSQRSMEEVRAGELLGFESRSPFLPEAPRREFRYRFILPLHLPPQEGDTACEGLLADSLDRIFAETSPRLVYAPAGYGGHVDHVLVRNACVAAVPAGQLFLYEDAPYCFEAGPGRVGLRRPFRALLAAARLLHPEAFRPAPSERARPVLEDVTQYLGAKVAAVGAYRTQVSEFFHARGGVRTALTLHSQGLVGDRAGYGDRARYFERYWSFA